MKKLHLKPLALFDIKVCKRHHFFKHYLVCLDKNKQILVACRESQHQDYLLGFAEKNTFLIACRESFGVEYLGTDRI